MFKTKSVTRLINRAAANEKTNIKNALASHQDGEPDGSHTVISSNTELKGNITAVGNVYVYGTVIGNIAVQSGLINIMASGKVEGDLTSSAIQIDGRVVGSCVADALEILGHGEVNGLVKSNKFSIEYGGVFIGQSESLDVTSETSIVDNHTAVDNEIISQE